MQQNLAKKVIIKKINLNKINYIGGIDVSYKNNSAVSAAVIFNYPKLSLIETRIEKSRIQFPYIPTLLAFREAPPILKVLKHLHYKPDLLIVEGHGLAHPYRCGLASHVGVISKIPTIGVAKNILCGRVGEYRNGQAPILQDGETLGKAILIEHHTKPIYVSVGNLITLEQAVEVTVKTIRRGRMPEPLKLAHKFAKVGIH